MTRTLQARVLWSFLGLGRLRGRGGGRAREWHQAIWWRPATRNARRAAASAGTFYAGARSLSLWATCIQHGDGGAKGLLWPLLHCAHLSARPLGAPTYR